MINGRQCIIAVAGVSRRAAPRVRRSVCVRYVCGQTVSCAEKTIRMSQNCISARRRSVLHRMSPKRKERIKIEMKIRSARTPPLGGLDLRTDVSCID